MSQPFHPASTLTAASTPRAIRQSLSSAERMVASAKLIGWPAMEESWMRDVTALRARLGAACLERARA